MEFPIELLSRLDITNLLAMAAMLWFMTSRLDKKFEKSSEEMEFLRMDISNLRRDVQEVDKRLCRLEGVVSSKEFCALRADHQHKKAD